MAQLKPLNKNIDVLILAGGKGERLKSVVSDKPKVLAEISGQTFIDLILKNLFSNGFEKVIISVGYLKGKIIQHIKDNYPKSDIQFSEEDTPLGTGGAIKHALKLIKTDPFLVLNGDSTVPINFDDFLSFHYESNSAVSMAVAKPREEKDYGALGLDSSNRVINYNEKAVGGGEFSNAGVYLINQKAAAHFPEENAFSIEEDFFPKILNHGFYGFVCEGDLIDIGTPERLQKAREVLRND